MPDTRGRDDPKKAMMRDDIEKIRALLQEEKKEKWGTVREMARITGLSRSESHLLTRNDASYYYKKTGLSRKIAERLLKTNEVPEEIKVLVREYLSKRGAGLYGHDQPQKIDPSVA